MSDPFWMHDTDNPPWMAGSGAREAILAKIREMLMSRAVPQGQMMPPPADFNQPQPPLLGVGDPLGLKMAPGLYTSGQNGGGLNLPMAPGYLQR